MNTTSCVSRFDDGFEFDDAAFRKFYKPLSNLPTPPPSRNTSATQSPRIVAEDAGSLISEFLAPAVHLTRVLPPGLSLEPPSIAIVHTILSHANLSMDIIALAVCILDALPIGKFRNSFRTTYPRTRQTLPTQKRHTFHSAIPSPTDDNVLSEVAILAALIIANKFVVDEQQSMAYYSIAWGRNLWSCEQINMTEQCIMENLGYRLLPLWHGSHIKEARHDIEYARRELLDETSDLALEAKEYEFYSTKPMSSGQAVVGVALQLTPSDTPTSQRSSSDDAFSQATRDAFSRPRALPEDYLQCLPEPMSPR